MMLAGLRSRNLQPEIMDDPSLDPREHRRALAALARINRISRSARILWPAIRDLARARQAAGSASPLRVLDIATGGGDLPVQLKKLAATHGLNLDIAGCDVSPVALEHARQHAARQSAEVEFFPLNVLEEPIPTGYDVITASLFLHHLDEEQARIVLGRMKDAAGTMMLVNDLARSRLGWLAAYVVTRLLTRSRTVHIDGPRSVEGAFTPQEALRLAREAGWQDPSVRGVFPFRFLLAGKVESR